MMAKRRKQKPNALHLSPPSQPTVIPSVEDKDDALERSKYVYELVNGWIGNADNKVSVSCGIFSGVFGVVSFLAQNYIKEPNDGAVVNGCLRTIYKYSSVISLILMGIAIFFFVLAIIPNLKKSGNDGEKKVCPIFYGDISKMPLDEYRRLMSETAEKHFQEELITETYQNAKICMNKMKRYKMGVRIAFIAIIVAGISFASHFFMYR